MSELKPCPFCGGEADFERLGDRRQSCIVVCTDCGGRHESGDEGERNGDSWNRRYPTAWCACGDSHTSDSVCVNCLAEESDGAPEIGTQYRDESGAVVAVVAPVRPDSAMIEAGHFAPAGIYGTGVVRCVEHYRQMLAALPEPD